MKSLTNLINGRAMPTHTDRYLDNIDPATGAVYSRLPDSDERDVAAAYEAAAAAFPAWSATPAEQRSRILLRMADLLEARLEQFALAECIDAGKPITRCRVVEVPRAIQNLRFFATAILHTQSDLHITDHDALNYTLRRPRGVCGLISPWNLPLYLFTWKIAPALATGNTAVAKPSEITPMTAYLLGELAEAAGLPPGVLNIVHGLGAKVGAAIVRHPGITTISFTGGTATGADIAAAAGPMFKRVSLELGGKNPNVIFADADYDRALETSVQAAFANSGQICLCGSRILVEQAIYERFTDDFVARVQRLKIGDPLDPATEQGALVSAAHRDKVAGYVELARREGGEILCGGRPATPPNERCRGGYFFEPTVMRGLGPGCRTNQEEIFGPVVTILPFADEAEALAIANGTPYGLAALLWTRDVDRAHRVAERLQSGVIWVNCWMLRDLRTPFGGMKQSGVGREGGAEALRFFTEARNVCVRVGA